MQIPSRTNLGYGVKLDKSLMHVPPAVAAAAMKYSSHSTALARAQVFEEGANLGKGNFISGRIASTIKDPYDLLDAAKTVCYTAFRLLHFRRGVSVGFKIPIDCCGDGARKAKKVDENHSRRYKCGE